MDKSSMWLGNYLVHPSMQWFQSAVVQLCGGMDKSSMQLANCLVHPSMQWFQSAVVQLCGVQDCLLHVTEALTRQLCASARQFLETLDGGPLTAELVERAGGQTALLETLLSRYDPSRNMERESKCWSGEVNPNKLGYIREVA